MKIEKIAGVYVGLLRSNGKFYYASNKSRIDVISKLLNLAQNE
jgi:hypothetical protein